MHTNESALTALPWQPEQAGQAYSRAHRALQQLIRCWLPQVRTSRYAGLDTLCPSGPVMPFSKVSFCRYAAGMHD